MSSKKEEQRRIREEKQQPAKQRAKVLGIAWKLALVVLVPLVVVVLLQGLRSNAQLVSPAVVSADDHVRGSADAPVTLVIYGDFQCPACREGADVFARAWARIGSSVQMVFRHYPLDSHRHSHLAARYAEAAGRQETFWPMHDMLYANQALWSASSDPRAVFDGFAIDLGLDLERLQEDLSLQEVQDKIRADQRGGTRAGVRATPSLFINGRPAVTPRTAVELEALVTRELRRIQGEA